MSFSGALAALLPLSAHAQAPEGAGKGRDNEAVQIGEIVVTATRSSERLSRVPVSVTAFDQAKLDQQGVRSVDDVARLTPGVVFTRTGFAGNNQIAIRGISSTVGASTTGVYIDDTPIQVRSLGFASSTAYPEVFDLARVEILRGPQGTLFGAGSEGGTVRFISPEPGYSQYSGYGRSELSFTKDGSPNWELGAAVGGPIVQDRVGFRASVWGRRDGGYIDQVSQFDNSVLKKDANSRDAFSARLALGLRPTDWLTVTPSVYFQRTTAYSSPEYMDRISDPDKGVFRNAEPVRSKFPDKFVLPSLNVEAEFGDFKLTSVTSKFVRTGRPLQDYTLTFPPLLLGFDVYRDALFNPLVPDYILRSQFHAKQDNFVQEIRLQYSRPDARLSGIVGLFVQRAKQTTGQTFIDPMLPELISSYFGGATVEQVFGIPMIDATTSYAASDVARDRQDALFGELTYRVTDRLKLTAGARYAKTSLEYSTFQAGPWAGTPTLSASGKQKEKPFTPKFGVTYEFDVSNMVYATAAKGFRVGGVNKPIPIISDACRGDLEAFGLSSGVGPYNSDQVWSYEVGAKNGNLLNGRLQIYSSAYYIKWSKIQQSIPLSNCGFEFVDNLGSAVSKGVDVQFQAKVAEGLQLGGSVAYNTAYYTQTVFGAPTGAGGERGIIVNDGNALPTAPWMVTLDADYEHEYADEKVGYVHATYTFRSRNNRRLPQQDPTTLSYNPDQFGGQATQLVNLRMGMRVAGVDMSLFANNLFNSHPVLTRDNLANGGLVFFSTTFVPRTVGLTTTYKF
ncbi:MAG TPA: TonB-dependent receptor [Phenylobacterium sp.]|uniref:TonB-dependent receptor n=1 Tax=Phenylobacterium sp. TaxID=1871053 RepID=UPI002B47C71D|nr:TonB-dependent receptor [Phenylobacterium sp.]HKR90595.1 TonB-dependent receptor [Phenylobacterium sp.]